MALSLPGTFDSTSRSRRINRRCSPSSLCRRGSSAWKIWPSYFEGNLRVELSFTHFKTPGPREVQPADRRGLHDFNAQILGDLHVRQMRHRASSFIRSSICSTGALISCRFRSRTQRPRAAIIHRGGMRFSQQQSIGQRDERLMQRHALFAALKQAVDDDKFLAHAARNLQAELPHSAGIPLQRPKALLLGIKQRAASASLAHSAKDRIEAIDRNRERRSVARIICLLCRAPSAEGRACGRPHRAR